jgi:AcrR family transcriptional regulator
VAPEPTERPRRQPAGAAVLREDVTDAIADAMFRELAETGYGRLSMEAVAKRAGVGKTAIYRRWPSKQAMVVALASQVAVGAIDQPDTGSLREDVLAFLGGAADALTHPLARTIIPDLLAETVRNEQLTAAFAETVREPRRQRAAELLHRAVRRGELAADIDLELALDFLAGPLYWRIAVVRTPRSADYRGQLADMIIAALRQAGGDRPEVPSGDQTDTPVEPAPPGA